MKLLDLIETLLCHIKKFNSLADGYEMKWLLKIPNKSRFDREH